MSTGGTGKGACFTGGVILIGDGIIAPTSTPIPSKLIGVLFTCGAGFAATGSGVSKSMMVFPDISLFLPTGI